MELRDIQIQITGPGEDVIANEENIAIPSEVVEAKDEKIKEKPAHGKKDKAKTVDDLKQEIQMVKLVFPLVYLKIKSFLMILMWQFLSGVCCMKHVIPPDKYRNSTSNTSGFNLLEVYSHMHQYCFAGNG